MLMKIFPFANIFLFQISICYHYDYLGSILFLSLLFIVYNRDTKEMRTKTLLNKETF